MVGDTTIASNVDARDGSITQTGFSPNRIRKAVSISFRCGQRRREKVFPGNWDMNRRANSNVPYMELTEYQDGEQQESHMYRLNDLLVSRSSRECPVLVVSLADIHQICASNGGVSCTAVNQGSRARYSFHSCWWSHDVEKDLRL